MPKRLVTRITDRRGPEATTRHRGLKALLAVGILLSGVAAILEPTPLAIPSVRLIGATMLVAGLFQLTLAMSTHRHEALSQGLGIGIINTGVGALFVADPELGVTTLSLLLAVAQIAIGLERSLAALRDRGSHWPWLVALGALLVTTGTAIALGWPVSGLAAIGRFVGINLVVEGVTWLTILWRARGQSEPRVTLAPVEKPAAALNRRRR